MSKPSKLSQVTIGEVASSTGPQPALVDANGRIRAMGTRGALVAGGPILEGRMLKSTTVTNQTLTADQLVGGHISFANNAGAAATITMPTVAEIFTYLTREVFAANGDPTANVNATTLLSVRSIPVTSFRCTFSVGTGNIPTLSWASGVEYYPAGPGNAALGGTTLALTASTSLTFEFFTVQSSSVVSPRIGFYPVWSVGLGGAYVAPNWSAVLTVGNTSGAFDPTINSGQQTQYVGSIRIGGNNVAATAASATSVAIGSGASTGAFATSVALGAGATVTAANQLMLGTAAETVVFPGDAQFTDTALGTTNALALNYLAGAPVGAANNGTVLVDGTNSRLYMRIGAVWKYLDVPTGAGVGTWASVLAAGNTTGTTDPTIDSGQQIQYAASIRIGGNSVAATAASATSVAIGSGATTGAFASSVAFGAGATATAANQIMLGTAAETVSFPGDAQFTDTALGTTNALALNYLAGVPVGAASNGTVLVDGTDSRLYVRIGAAWKYINAFTGGNTWANVLATGNTTGASNPTIDSGQRVQFTGGIAIGGNANAATVGGVWNIAIGGSTNCGPGANTIVIGNGATSTGTASTVLGDGSTATANSTTVLGSGATAAWSESTAIGINAATTAANQVMVGRNTETIRCPGSGTALEIAGKIKLNGGTPTFTAVSGTSPIAGNWSMATGSSDVCGQATTGANNATGAGAFTVTITFNATYTSSPFVVATSATTNITNIYVGTVTATTAIIGGTAVGANPLLFNYHVLGRY